MQEQQQDPHAQEPRRRGFASMASDRQREIARAGGQAAHKRGTAHEFAPDEARRAGQKGGLSISRDRAHMAEIGRLGGITRGQRLRAHGAACAVSPSSAEGPMPMPGA